MELNGAFSHRFSQFSGSVEDPADCGFGLIGHRANFFRAATAVEVVVADLEVLPHTLHELALPGFVIEVPPAHPP